jgi:phage repressor protein C with HTH and peptisase S24 domain
MLKALKVVSGVDINWLLTGEGSMFIQPPEPAPDGKTDTVSNLIPTGKFATVANLETRDKLETEGKWETVSHLGTGSKTDTVSNLEPDGKTDTVSHSEPEGKYDTVSHLPDQEDQAIQPYEAGLLIRNGHKIKGRRAIELAVERADPDICFVNYYSAQSAGAGPGRDIQAYLEATRMPVMREFLSPWRPEQIGAMEVRGDSMTKVGLFDRDIVLYVPNANAKEGDGIYVISIDSKMQVKRIEFDILGETLKVISENDRYAPRVLNTKELISKVVIEGKVIGWLHRHPY